MLNITIAIITSMIVKPRSVPLFSQASLLHPFRPRLVVKPPAANPPRGPKYRDRPRTVKITRPRQVHYAAVVIAQRVLRRTVRHEHDVVLAAESHALIEINGCSPAAESIRRAGRKSRLAPQTECQWVSGRSRP